MHDITLKGTAAVPDCEVTPAFLQGMVDRMGMSYFKYGLMADAYPSKVDALASLQARLDKYKQTGNTEYLMDVANFAMIEFTHPRLEGAFYAPTDSDGSPGRVWGTGHVSENANTPGRENLRRGGSNLRTDGGLYRKEGD